MPSSQGPLSRLTRHGRVALLELTSPQTMNSFDAPMQTEMDSFLTFMENHAAETPVAVITGAGRAFCAGGDVKAMDRGEIDDRYVRELNRLILRLSHLDAVVVAAVNGLAYGGGFSLALACDLIFASTEATFSLAHVKIGLVPDMGAHYFLPRLIGQMRARQLLFTGERVVAEEALRLGLVNRVVPPSELLPTTLEFAQKLAEGATTASVLTKRMLRHTSERSLESMLEEEVCSQQVCFRTHDHREGVRAFLEKRTPTYLGR